VPGPATSALAISDTARDSLLNAGRCVFVVLLALLLIGISKRAIPRALRRIADSSRLDERMELRTRTLSGLVVSTLTVVIWTLTTVTVLSQVGVKIAPLLAGAGVVGLAVGFGAQQLVRDVISGFFVLVEDQYSVGDYVTAGGVTGVVESISLRLTRVRGEDGVLHHVRNGDLLVVSNFSRGYSVATVNVPVPAGMSARAGEPASPSVTSVARPNSATRKGWSERSGRCDELMKFGLSSSGCETRPAKGRAAPAGSEPCDGRGDATGDA